MTAMMRTRECCGSARVCLLGVPLDNVTPAEALDRIFDALRTGSGGWVLTPNLDILRRLVRDPGFREMTTPATLRLADGMPLLWASRLQGTPLRARVAGSDLIWLVCDRAAREERTVFFLGGNPGAAENAAIKLSERYPGLRVVGTECPPLGFEADPEYMRALERRISSAVPEICFVALGSPKQDRVIRDLVGKFPSIWFLGVGISFSFVSGEVKRAPRCLQRLGMEWLHRLAQEPRRLGRRYLVEGLPFAAFLFWRSLCRRAVGLGSRPEGSQGPVCEGGGDRHQVAVSSTFARDVGESSENRMKASLPG